MTLITKTYSSKSEYDRDQPIMNSRGFAVLYHNTPYIITWEKGERKTIPIRNLTSAIFIRELAESQRVNIT